MKDSDAYKTYYDLATRKVIPKQKYKKLPAKGLETLSEVSLSKAKQMKSQPKEARLDSIALKPADQISWKSSNDEDNNNQDDDDADDQDDDDANNQNDDCQDDDNEQTKIDNDGDDFVHLKLSTFNEEERHEEKLDKEAEGSDLRFHTPYQFESINDEAYDEVTQGDNVKEEKLDKEKTNEEEEVNELYNNMNINLEGRDTRMKDSLLANIQAT
nr:hypothetical protein [Tanacetum cinerariifolium]